jgi:hypothetical protein
MVKSVSKQYVFPPTKGDLKEWRELCEYLDQQFRKCDSMPTINRHLLEKDPLMLGMRRWMRENDCELVWWDSGWGYRLRKHWKERLAKMEDLISTKQRV